MNVFWSSVELKYRQIQEIQINIKVTGVIVVEEENVLNYTDKHKFRWFMNSLDMDEALNNFGEIKAYVEKTNITDYNIIVTLTGLRGMVTTSDPFYYSNFANVLGYAFTKGVCDPKNNGVICEDDGKFGSLSAVVHEIAHSLGLRHDGDTRIFEDNIDYSSCKTSDPGIHYAMDTKNLHSFDKYIWSNCSKKYFEFLKRDEEMACIGER
ncbi:venom metalloproteinase 3-like [Trichogramma pretiosum]|uniref:venom metalloproteinase 3-like n=1 Tax=Trichogramma pretiosum TaxID=7493 RepID=UPI0006C95635|nr:venom metalloproteinase 3-like [Trichogramma pretiosum]